MLVNDYLGLLETYTSGKMTADEFERAYLDKFKKESRVLSPHEFAVLDRLFGAVDAYCGDTDLRDGEDLDESALLDEAARARDALRSFKVQQRRQIDRHLSEPDMTGQASVHVAPCTGVSGFDWSHELEAWWLVAAVGRRPGFSQPGCAVFLNAMLDGAKVWDARAGDWHAATAESVQPIVWRAVLAITVAPGAGLDSVSSSIQAWRKYDKVSALKKRYGKRPPPAPGPFLARDLLEEPSKPTEFAVRALRDEVGPYTMWRIGDLGRGLHGIYVGEREHLERLLSLRADSTQVRWHRTTRELPIT